MSKLSIGILEARRNARIKELESIGPVISGSLVQIRVKCGNLNCRCARGERHISNILTKKIAAKTKSTYVPVEMLEEVKSWAQNFKKAKKLLKEISDYNERILRQYIRTKRAKGRNLAAVNKKNIKK